MNCPLAKDKGLPLPRLTRIRPPETQIRPSGFFIAALRKVGCRGLSLHGHNLPAHAYEPNVEQHEHAGAAALISSQRGGLPITRFKMKELSRKSVTIRFSKASAVLVSYLFRSWATPDVWVRKHFNCREFQSLSFDLCAF